MGKHKHERHYKHKHDRHHKHGNHDQCGCGGSGNECHCDDNNRGHCDIKIQTRDCHPGKRVEYRCEEPRYVCRGNGDMGDCWKDNSCCRRYWNYEQPCFGCETPVRHCHKRKHTKVICICNRTPCECKHW